METKIATRKGKENMLVINDKTELKNYKELDQAKKELNGLFNNITNNGHLSVIREAIAEELNYLANNILDNSNQIAYEELTENEEDELIADINNYIEQLNKAITTYKAVRKLI